MIKTFEEYEKLAKKTIKYQTKEQQGLCAILGLNGESGEIAEKFKKLIRGDYLYDNNFKFKIALELGDILWYIVSMARILDRSLEDIANMNIKKLKDRLSRNKIQGNGDNR